MSASFVRHHSEVVPAHEPFVSEGHWNVERPRVLVVCCSDGRLQETIDEFLQHRLGIRHYDRFYAPGGPAALVPGGHNSPQTHQYRSDAAFLIDAHDVQDLVLIFHSPASPGPEAAVCAHYRRVYPFASAEEIRAQQVEDMKEVMAYLRGLRLRGRIHAYRAEVLPDSRVQFVSLALPIAV